MPVYLLAVELSYCALSDRQRGGSEKEKKFNRLLDGYDVALSHEVQVNRY